jgi:hypothetical protein
MIFVAMIFVDADMDGCYNRRRATGWRVDHNARPVLGNGATWSLKHDKCRPDTDAA